MNKAFSHWFKNSKAKDEYNNPQVFYHGSIASFTEFDLSRVRADETDALYNGFWFTSEQNNASPAWRNPKYVNAYYLSIQNPASHETVREVYRDIISDRRSYFKYSIENGFRSWADAVRYELQKLGYDGVIHQEVPTINHDEYEKKSETVYTNNRGIYYKLKNDEDFGGVDLYRFQNGCEDHLTGYVDLTDFLNQHTERVFVVFQPNQIKSVNNEGTWCSENNDVRY